MNTKYRLGKEFLTQSLRGGSAVPLLEILKNWLRISMARFSCFYPHLNSRAMLGMFGKWLLSDLLPPLPYRGKLYTDETGVWVTLRDGIA